MSCGKEWNGKLSMDRNGKFFCSSFPLSLLHTFGLSLQIRMESKLVYESVSTKLFITGKPIRWRKDKKWNFYALPKVSNKQRYIVTSSVNVMRKSTFLFYCFREKEVVIGIFGLLVASRSCWAGCYSTPAIGMLCDTNRLTAYCSWFVFWTWFIKWFFR